MDTKRKDRVGYGWLLAAGLFLWNPVVNMTDVLPDLIGYLFLLVGISRIADLSDRLGEARERFRSVMWIALGELAMQLLVNVFLQNVSVVDDPHGQNLPAWTLLFSFAIFAIECYFLIPAYRDLFYGLGDLAERKNAVHLKNDRHDRSQYDRMATFSIVFVVGKNLLSLLPELTSISTYESELENPIFRFDWYEYADVLRLTLLIPALILTGIWIARWISLFSGVCRDENFLTAVKTDYAERIAPDYGLLLGRRVRTSFLLFRIGTAFFATFLLLHDKKAVVPSAWQGVELLPDWALPVFLAVGVWLIRDLVAVRRYEVGVGIAAVASGMAEWIFCMVYYQNHTAMESRYFTKAYDLMMALRAVGILSAVLAGVCLCLLVVRTQRIVKEHLLVFYGSDEALSAAATERLQATYRSRIIGAYSLIGLGTAGRIADWILRPWFAWFWWIPMIFTVALILVFSSLFSDLAEGLAFRYPSGQENGARE